MFSNVQLGKKQTQKSIFFILEFLVGKLGEYPHPQNILLN